MFWRVSSNSRTKSAVAASNSMGWGIAALAAALAAPECAAMQQQQIANLRANGEHAKAACYETCSPSDAVCMKQCDNRHPTPVDPQVAAYARLAASAAAVDAAKPKAAVDGDGSSPSTSPPGSSSRRSLTINGTTYTGGDRLGQPCGLDAPCPDGYKCHLVTERSGQCVQ